MYFPFKLEGNYTFEVHVLSTFLIYSCLVLKLCCSWRVHVNNSYLLDLALLHLITYTYLRILLGFQSFSWASNSDSHVYKHILFPRTQPSQQSFNVPVDYMSLVLKIWKNSLSILKNTSGKTVYMQNPSTVKSRIMGHFLSPSVTMVVSSQQALKETLS